MRVLGPTGESCELLLVGREAAQREREREESEYRNMDGMDGMEDRPAGRVRFLRRHIAIINMPRR